jgi:CBS domain-containing protein
MTIARVLASRPVYSIVTATADMPVHEVIGLLAVHRIGALPVMDGDQVAGILSERDVLYCLASDGAGALDRPVREVMSAPAISVTPDTSVLAALSRMTRRRIRHLPVIDGGQVAGFVSIGDLVKFRIDAIEREAEALRSYIQAG